LVYEETSIGMVELVSDCGKEGKCRLLIMGWGGEVWGVSVLILTRKSL